MKLEPNPLIEITYLKCVCNVQSLSEKIVNLFYSLYDQRHVNQRPEEKVLLSMFPRSQLTSSSDFLLFFCAGTKNEGKNYAAPHLTAIDTEIAFAFEMPT